MIGLLLVGWPILVLRVVIVTPSPPIRITTMIAASATTLIRIVPTTLVVWLYFECLANLVQISKELCIQCIHPLPEELLLIVSVPHIVS